VLNVFFRIDVYSSRLSFQKKICSLLPRSHEKYNLFHDRMKNTILIVC
jgi:hypothetical protein